MLSWLVDNLPSKIDLDISYQVVEQFSVFIPHKCPHYIDPAIDSVNGLEVQVSWWIVNAN